MEIKEFLENINNVEFIEEEEDVSVKYIYNNNPNRLQDYEDSVIALAIYLELNIDDIDDIENVNGDYTYTYNNDYYYCGTEDELFIAVKDYIEITIWAFNSSFLRNYGILYELDYAEDILILLQDKCDIANDTILKLVDWENNADEITREAISSDGIGHFLNSYDGTTSEITVNNTDYIICRS